jgi:hypothetical protein
MQPSPYRVLTVGIHGSASTWVFNVTRELLVARFGADAVYPCHATRADDLRDALAHQWRHFVAKTHGWTTLPAFIQECSVLAIVSVRDPRDALLSIMQRFGEPFDRCMRGIQQDCRVALACANAGHPVLRYEDRFFESPAALDMVSDHLGLKVPKEAAERIFRQYATEAVRSFAAGIAALPAHRLGGEGGFRFDLLTQITNTHIGDGRVGKWRELLDPQQQAAANTFLGSFIRMFGYSTERVLP